MNGPFQWPGGLRILGGGASSVVEAERGAADRAGFCCLFFLEGIVGGKVSRNEEDGGAGGVFVSCGVAVSSVWWLDTSALAKVGAIVESWSARAAMSSLFWDLSDVLVSGFMAGRVFFSACKRSDGFRDCCTRIRTSSRRFNRLRLRHYKILIGAQCLQRTDR